MPDIICEDIDHASRSGDPGWAATLGTSSVPDVRGYLCAACVAARANDVMRVRPEVIAAAKAAVSAHIEAAYSAGAQQSLMALYSEAAVNGKPDRRDYIQAALDWLQSVLAVYSAYRTAAENAPDVASLYALEMVLPGSPPDVTVTGAMAILS